MKSQDFRTEMIGKVRAFDAWAWKDETEFPECYRDYEFPDWFELFCEFLEKDSV